MISVTQIQRHFAAGRFEQLLDIVAANGMPLPMALRVRLSSSDSAAVAFGLHRVAELTYGPTPLGREMTDFLLDQQHADGSWEGDPLVTAAALAALLRVHRDDFARQDAVAPAIGRGLAALASLQADDGLFRSDIDRSREDRALAAGYVLLLLADEDAVRASIRYADLLNWFESHEREIDDTTDRLWRLARCGSHADAAPLAA